uniref:SET domain-containing protein n=1 Tax=Caenorhabditis tropicalis TaxID=1561998 RepID=A0A1I7UF48_9PELO
MEVRQPAPSGRPRKSSPKPTYRPVQKSVLKKSAPRRHAKEPSPSSEEEYLEDDFDPYEEPVAAKKRAPKSVAVKQPSSSKRSREPVRQSSEKEENMEEDFEPEPQATYVKQSCSKPISSRKEARKRAREPTPSSEEWEEDFEPYEEPVAASKSAKKLVAVNQPGPSRHARNHVSRLSSQEKDSEEGLELYEEPVASKRSAPKKPMAAKQPRPSRRAREPSPSSEEEDLEDDFEPYEEPVAQKKCASKKRVEVKQPEPSRRSRNLVPKSSSQEKDSGERLELYEQPVATKKSSSKKRLEMKQPEPSRRSRQPSPKPLSEDELFENFFEQEKMRAQASASSRRSEPESSSGEETLKKNLKFLEAEIAANKSAGKKPMASTPLSRSRSPSRSPERSSSQENDSEEDVEPCDEPVRQPAPDRRSRSPGKSSSSEEEDESMEEDRLARLDNNVPHFYRVLVERRNALPFNSPLERLRDFWFFIKMEMFQRTNYWKEQSQKVVGHTDALLFFEERIRTQRRQARDGVICLAYYRTKHPDDSDIKRSALMAVRCFSSIGKVYDPKEQMYDLADSLRINFPKELEEYERSTVYKAPQTRIRITDNITFSKVFKIPVYSDIEGETAENVNIPNDFIFDYLLENIVDIKREPLLAKGIELSEKPENIIKCECHSLEYVVDCFDNPNCPCFKMNHWLQQLQKAEGKPAEFHSFNPLVLDRMGAPYYSHVGFACSSLCGCQGNCTNNSCLLVDKHLFPLEIYRPDKDIGFGVRTTAVIPAGLPIMDFCAELVEAGHLEVDVQSYSMQLTDEFEDPKLFELLKTAHDWTPEFKKVLKKLYKMQFHLDCKRQGNVGRMINHSCTPNVEPMRVFQKSVTPANMRLLMFSIRTIAPGEPLTMDYGANYTEISNCLCKSIACRFGKHFPKFSRFNFKKIARCFSGFNEDQTARLKMTVNFESEKSNLFREADVLDERQDLVEQRDTV